MKPLHEGFFYNPQVCSHFSLLFPRSESVIFCSSIPIPLPSQPPTLDRSVSFSLSAVLLRPPARWLNLIFHMRIALPPHAVSPEEK